MSIPQPVDADTRCAGCRHRKADHKGGDSAWRGGACGNFLAPPPEPEDHERCPAMVVTTWTCNACGEDSDVWGEGAVFTWMTCDHCGVDCWLDFDKGLIEATP